MGDVGKIIAGQLLIGAGVVIGVFTGQWGLGLAVSAYGAGMIYDVAKGTRALADQQGAILENRTGVKLGLPVVYGEVRVGPIVADARIDGNSFKRKRMVMVCAFAHGSADGTGVEAIDKIYLDDALAWDDGVVQEPFASSIEDDGDSYQTRHLHVIIHLGTDSQVVDSVVTAIFPTEWPSTSKGLGIAYAVLLMWYNPDIYGGGLPRVNAVIRGQKLYDPRTSSTAYSTNSVLAIRDFLTADIYGFGYEVGDIDDADSFDLEPDYCDELVTPYSGFGTQKRFETSGIVNTNKAIRASLADLTTACRGTVLNADGSWKLRIRKEQSSTGLEVTPTTTVEGTWKYIVPGSSQTPNSVIINYVDPERKYQVDSVQWPEPGQSNPFLVDDNNYVRQLQIDLPFTTNRLRAQQIGMVLLREAREGISVVVTGKQVLLPAEVNDILDVTQPSPGWDAKPFWVVATNYRPHQAAVDFILVEYESTVYELDEQFPQPIISDTTLPNPFTVPPPTDISVEPLYILEANGRVRPYLEIKWTDAVDPFVTQYDILVRRMPVRRLNWNMAFDSADASYDNDPTVTYNPASSWIADGWRVGDRFQVYGSVYNEEVPFTILSFETERVVKVSPAPVDEAAVNVDGLLRVFPYAPVQTATSGEEHVLIGPLDVHSNSERWRVNVVVRNVLGMHSVSTMNVNKWSDDITQWSTVGPPTITPGQTDPEGGSTAHLVEDTSAIGGMNISMITTGLGFTEDGGKLESVWLKEGSAAVTEIDLFDNFNATVRLRIRVTWNAGVPTLSIVSGSGTLFDPIAGAESGWYHILFIIDGVVAVTNNELRFWPAGGSTAVGDVYVWRFHTHDFSRYTTETYLSNALMSHDVLLTNGVVALTTADDPYTIGPSDAVLNVDAIAGTDFDALVPLAVLWPGRQLTLRRTNSTGHDVILGRSGSDTIDGATSLTLYRQNDSVILTSDGDATWSVEADSGRWG